MAVIKFYSLPIGLLGFDPETLESQDLKKEVVVNGRTYVTPFSVDLTVGSTINLSSWGATVWDYYGMTNPRRVGSSAQYVVQNFQNMKIGVFFAGAENILVTAAIVAASFVAGIVVGKLLRR